VGLTNKQPTAVRLDIDPDVQWLSTVNRKLGDLNIVLAGEVDCIKGRYTGQPDTFLELKTRKIADRPESRSFLWYKKLYMQSYLLGVPELFIGYHSDSILRRTEAINVADLPSRMGRGGQSWNPQPELDRGYTALTAIRRSCSEQLAQCPSICDDKVCRVEVAKGIVKIRALTAPEVSDLEITSGSEQRIGIVPSEVIERLRMVSEGI